MDKLNKSVLRLYVIASLYVVIAVLLITSITYGWFVITNENHTYLVSQIAGVEAEYQFYVYNDQMHNGSMNQTLINNITTTEEDLKYELVDDPTTLTLIDGYVAPGERFSFAIKVSNVGSTEGKISLNVSQITSFGYPSYDNKIQTAFIYDVTKISYMDSISETEDQKNLLNLTYHEGHFLPDAISSYDLINNVPLSYNQYHSVVIYFDFYFDPLVYGIDSEGIPYTNSNIFMGQRLSINALNMILSV